VLLVYDVVSHATDIVFVEVYIGVTRSEGLYMYIVRSPVGVHVFFKLTAIEDSIHHATVVRDCPTDSSVVLN